MRIKLFALFLALILCGCSLGPENELEGELEELKKMPVTTLEEATDALKAANDFALKVRQTEKEEEEKYPELTRDAKRLVDERLKQFTDLGGEKVKGWVDGALAMAADKLEAIKNFLDPEQHMSPEMKKRLEENPSVDLKCNKPSCFQY